MLFLYVEIAVRMCVRLFVLHVCMQNMLSARLQYRAGLYSARTFAPSLSSMTFPMFPSRWFFFFFPTAPVTFLTCVSTTLGQRGEVEFEKAARPDRYDSKHFFWISLAHTHFVNWKVGVCGGVCGLADGMAWILWLYFHMALCILY